MTTNIDSVETSPAATTGGWSPVVQYEAVTVYPANGRWADYLFSERIERIYIVLSLVAKTALVLQVYASVLVG